MLLTDAQISPSDGIAVTAERREMGKIGVLDFEVANLIAAGEVVDRPSSVMKELLENAIDAGATVISAEITCGGVRSMRVTDDGCGMSSEDMPLSLRRHATSKIHSAEDLSHIGTLGFRGEALAAISAVSDVTIISKTREAQSGTMLVSSAGRVTEISEVGCSDGTTVLVEDLFANVPARRKFLKRDATEAAACAAVVERVCLSHPEISVRFVSDGVVRFTTPGDGNVRNAVRAVLGRDFVRRLLSVEAERGRLTLTGFVGTPELACGNRNSQLFYINGRYVKSKTMTAALERAYTSYMAKERFPACVLFLTIPTDSVDVNVHPAKLEVKFSDERVIFELVYHAARAALEGDSTRPELPLSSVSRGKRLANAFVPLEGAPKGEQERLSLPDAAQKPSPPSSCMTVSPSETRPDGTAMPRAGEHTDRHSPSHAGREPVTETLTPSASLEVLARMNEAVVASPQTFPAPPEQKKRGYAEEVTYLSDIPTSRRGQERETEPAVSAFPSLSPSSSPSDVNCLSGAASVRTDGGVGASAPPPPAADTMLTEGSTEIAWGTETAQGETPLPPFRFVGELFSTYLLVETEDGALFIDKHAAHERILFERLLARQTSSGTVASQALLVPLTVSLSHEEAQSLSEYPDDLHALGFDYIADGMTASVVAIPEDVSTEDAETLFHTMLSELAEGAGDPAVTMAKRREQMLYQVACKAAIKGGRVYDETLHLWLIREVLRLPDVTVCPHGRPIAYRLTKRELDRMFDRIK